MFPPDCAVVHNTTGGGGGGGGAQLPNEQHACEKMKSEEEIAPPKLLLGLRLWAGKVNSRRPVIYKFYAPISTFRI